MSDENHYLVSSVKAAKFLGVSTSFLAKKRMQADSSLPYVKIGASVKYRFSDLIEYANQNIRQSTAEY